MKISYFLKKMEQFHSFNDLVYIYRRNNWIFDLRRYFNNYKNIEINKPIFLLGTQGSGLTLVSRIIRKHPDVVSVTGNCQYWSGADEMNSVLGPILPDEIKSIG